MSSLSNVMQALAVGVLSVAGAVAAIQLLESSKKQRCRRRVITVDSDSSEDSSEGESAPSKRQNRRAVARRSSQRKAINVDDINGGFGQHQGFSMEDTLHHNEKGRSAMKEKSPQDVVSDLQKGNARFFMGAASRPELSAFERRALIVQQFPSVSVLSCADSRVPVEIVFDQALGDMFVVRVAGNALGLSTLASLDYSVKHLEVKVIVVMGHEGCGAIKAATLPLETIEKESEALATVLKELKSGLDEASYSAIKDTRARDRELVTSNVRLQVDTLRKDASISAKIRSNELVVVGAFYEISSGICDFFYTLDSSNI